MDKKEVYSIDGMSCASCAAHVEESVKSLEGVSDVSVNLATEKTYFNKRFQCER